MASPIEDKHPEATRCIHGGKCTKERCQGWVVLYEGEEGEKVGKGACYAQWLPTVLIELRSMTPAPIIVQAQEKEKVNEQ